MNVKSSSFKSEQIVIEQWKKIDRYLVKLDQ